MQVALAGRMTIAFSEETRQLLEELVPSGRRTDFVDEAVQQALRQLAQEKLRTQMQECAREMYDEIMALEQDFHPLEEEAHRLT